MLKQTQSLRETSSSAFYITGGTLRGDAACYVRRQADQALFESLSQGQFCYVLTSRQMGKSSLMIRTAERLRESGTGVVVLDLTAVGQNLTAEQWYDGLLNRIGRQVQLEDELEAFWLANPRLGPLQRWMNAITEVVLPRYPGRLVIFIDEIDTVRSLPFTTDEFFAGIREFYNRRTSEPELERLTFCLLGVASPSDLIRDTRMTPFNIGRRIELHDFTEEEAAPLAEGLGRDEKAGSEILNRVLYWTGGHPYLTQRLCLAVSMDGNTNDTRDVDRLCEEIFFTRKAQDGDDNLVFVRERLLRSDVDLAGLLTLYDQVHRGKRVADDEANSVIIALHLSGIARHKDGYLKVRNRIYYRVFGLEWVKEHMPDAELRRQRAAYRKGLMRAAVIAAAILMVISTLTLIAYRQRNMADRQRIRAESQEESNRQQLYAAEMNLAMQSWEDAGIPRMADLLNNQIPKSGQRDLRGFEWYFLWGLINSSLQSFKINESVSTTGFPAERPIAFFDDNRRMAMTGIDPALIIIKDIVTGKQLMTITGHTDIIRSIDISPDGRLMASGSADKSVKIWDSETGREVTSLEGHNSQVFSVSFSPTGRQLATAGDDKSVKLWDINNWQEQITIQHPETVRTIAFSPDGKILATGCDDYIVRLWDPNSGKELKTLKGHQNVIWTISFSPDGARLVSGSGDLSAIVWDVASGKIAKSGGSASFHGKQNMIIPGDGGGITAVSVSPDGSLIAVASTNRTIRLFSAYTLQLINTIKGHGLFIDSLAFSSNSKILATSGKDGFVRLWDVNFQQEKILANISIVWSMTFCPDSNFLVIGGRDGIARVWDVKSPHSTKHFKGHTSDIISVAVSPDGQRLATGSYDNTVKMWDMTTEKELFTLNQIGDEPGAIAFSPDGRLLATTSLDKMIRLWDVTNGKEQFILKGHDDSVLSVGFSPDGQYLVSSSLDKTAILWDIKTRREISTLKNPSGAGAVAVSPDGRNLAIGGFDGMVRLWDISTESISLILKGHHGIINKIAFIGNSRLATGGFDNTVKIWDITNGHELLSRRHKTLITALASSPDGRILASAENSDVKLWFNETPSIIQKRNTEKLYQLANAH